MGMETPPRAWGRPASCPSLDPSRGNTPTGVGKTPPARASPAHRSETPPRAWGRPVYRGGERVAVGNTPTGVGKTSPRRSARWPKRKHPHGRGEDVQICPVEVALLETPPRAWGRPCEGVRLEKAHGNTPTGVGKTCIGDKPCNQSQKHPHGRGEDQGSYGGTTSDGETPPRAWGRPARRKSASFSSRNTPTGVGKTRCPAGRRCGKRKHPHGRGEDIRSMAASTCARETPPRAWGRPSLSTPLPSVD